VTRVEIDKLDVFMGEFREFRVDDRAWKDDIDKRILRVEAFVTSRRAVSERDDARGVSRRAYVAAVIAAVGIVVSIAISVVNAVT
jgi:hypothetical protein